MSLPLSIQSGQVAYIGRVTSDVPEFYPYKTSNAGAPVDIIPASDGHPVGVVLDTCLAGTACDVVTEGFCKIIGTSSFASAGDALYADVSTGYLTISPSEHLIGFCITGDFVYIRPELNL